jgi:hypothetical protein
MLIMKRIFSFMTTVCGCSKVVSLFILISSHVAYVNSYICVLCVFKSFWQLLYARGESQVSLIIYSNTKAILME